MAFVILWHFMTYAKSHKCNKLCQYRYQKNRIDQSNRSKNFKIFSKEQKINAKKDISKFLLHFWSNSFLKCFFVAQVQDDIEIGRFGPSSAIAGVEI